MNGSDGTATDTTVATALDSISTSLHTLTHLLLKQHFFLEAIMELNDQIGAAVTDLKTALANAKARIQSHADAQQAIITDLQSKLSSGAPGLTADQGQSVLASLTSLKSDLDQTAADIPAPAPVADPGTGSGETNVPVTSDPPTA